MSTTTGYQIAEVARRSGFSPPTLRYYEEVGLLPSPDRTEAGYRIYDDEVVERLAFIARAKRLGCTLDEIGALLRVWETDRCGPVKHGLRALVDAKLAETRTQLVELGQLADSLTASAALLAGQPVDGPCDENCGCAAVPPAAGEPPEPPIACSLDAGGLQTRLDEWREALAEVQERTPIDGGLRLTFPPDAPLAEIVRLVEAEHGCCQFFAFALTVDARGTALEVTAPAEAEDALTEVFGEAA